MRKKHDDYNLNIYEDKKKYIKSLNQRINKLAETFGTNSKPYTNKVKDIITQLDHKGLKYHESKKGIFQINESKENIENQSIWNTIENKKYLNMNTANEILQETFTKMKERRELSEDAPFIKQQLIDYTNEYMEIGDYVSENLSYLYSGTENANKALDILHITGRRKTYEELKQVQKALSLEISEIAF